MEREGLEVEGKKGVARLSEGRKPGQLALSPHCQGQEVAGAGGARPVRAAF